MTSTQREGKISIWITAILMLLWQAAAAHANSLEDCEQAQDVDRRILRCTDRIRQFPRDATAFFNRGSAYLSKGDLDRAIADYTGVIQIDPAYSPAYYHRGIAYESRKLYEQAIADFSKTVQINPRHSGAFDARARVYFKTDQRMLALSDAERAVFLDPFDERFLDTRAHIYEALGRAPEAITDYRRLLSGNPSTKSAIDGLRRLGASQLAVKAPADAAGKAKRITKPHHYVAPPRNDVAQPRYSREELECEAARHADPAGRYADYPCWARAALGARRR